MSFSVNTNVGAMVALQNLNSTQSQLMTTQNRINTGLKVSSAKDNAAIWAIAQNQRATSSSLNSVISSLQRGQSTVDVALSAGNSVSDLLLQMKEKALAAADTTLDTTSRAALNDEFTSLRDQISKVVTNAVFNVAIMLVAVVTVLIVEVAVRLDVRVVPPSDRSCAATVITEVASALARALMVVAVPPVEAPSSMLPPLNTALVTVLLIWSRSDLNSSFRALRLLVSRVVSDAARAFSFI